MAVKRLREGGDRDSDKPEEKRTLRPLPSFSTIIREAVMANQLQNMLVVLEPMVRRVVREEMEGVLVNELNTTQSIPRSSQMQIEDAEPSAYLQLVFAKPPSFPSIIFTGSKIEDSDNNPLQVLLISTDDDGAAAANSSLAQHYYSGPLRLELVVLDGDFPSAAGGQQEMINWTSDEFSRAIVRQRNGKRPLLTGDVSPTLRDGVATIGDLILTDNSSWIRSQNFRIGVRVAPGSAYEGPRIKEGLTASFRVKDHRGESNKKHYPPVLSDEVWRLEKIGKDGPFRSRLSARNIHTVQDFLKLLVFDAAQLRKILGMSERMWQSTVAHARTCQIGDKLYTYRKENCIISLSSICEVIKIEINGIPCSPQGLDRSQKAYVQEMVGEAYAQWNLLEESADGVQPWISTDHTALLQNHEPIMTQEASTSWYPGQLESPEFQIEEFDQDGASYYIFPDNPCE